MVTNFMNSGFLNLGEHLISLDSVDSTNNYAANLLRNEEVPEGTVILSGYQSLGKGQGGNKWFSDPGQNLLISIVLKPNFLKAERQFFMSMSISTGISEFIVSAAGESLIKWPNDILLNGKKVAGILIENTILQETLNSTVVGIGLNVNQRKFPSDLRDAVSLTMVTGKEYNLQEILNDLLGFIASALNPLYNGKYGEVKTRYLNRLHRLNEWARYIDDEGMFEGRINDIADTGELIVERHNRKSRLYGFRELQFA